MKYRKQITCGDATWMGDGARLQPHQLNGGAIAESGQLNGGAIAGSALDDDASFESPHWPSDGAIAGPPRNDDAIAGYHLHDGAT